MTEFRHLFGAVYILENREAGRVKIGMTINFVAGRLDDVNDKWSGRKVTCQICGIRLVVSEGVVPIHLVSGTSCPGGEKLPFEKDVKVAESYLMHLEKHRENLSGTEKGSIVKKIKTLEKRLSLYRNREHPVGSWKFHAVFYTECAEQVELISHELLADRLDRCAPIGEVFCCSSADATVAIEAALDQLGLLASARKETEMSSRRAFNMRMRSIQR